MTNGKNLMLVETLLRLPVADASSNSTVPLQTRVNARKSSAPDTNVQIGTQPEYDRSFHATVVSFGAMVSSYWSYDIVRHYIVTIL